MNAPVNAIKLQRGASHRKLALFATGTELRQFEGLQVKSLNRLLDLDNEREPSGLRNPNVKLFPHHIRSDRHKKRHHDAVSHCNVFGLPDKLMACGCDDLGDSNIHLLLSIDGTWSAAHKFWVNATRKFVFDAN